MYIQLTAKYVYSITSRVLQVKVDLQHLKSLLLYSCLPYDLPFLRLPCENRLEVLRKQSWAAETSSYEPEKNKDMAPRL